MSDNNNNNHNNDKVKLGAVWEEINKMRMEVAEMKGMLHMHFQEGVHHTPPCQQMKDLQKSLYSTLLAAIIALIAAFVNIAIAAHS